MKASRIVVGCLLIVILLIVGLAGTGYFVLMHTNLPLSALENALSQEKDFKVKGLRGTLASGFQVDSIRIEQPGLGTSEIEDVRFTYSGFWDLAVRKQFIIREFHVGKAHLFVQTHPASEPAPPPEHGFHEQSPGDALSEGLERFQIDAITIENVLVEDPKAEFKLAIPAIHWTGFCAERGSIELGELEVASDAVDIHTLPGSSALVGGQTVDFQKTLQGTLKPGAVPSVRRPIPFTLDLGIGPDRALFYRLRACDGKLECYVAADRSGYIRAQGIDLPADLNLKPYDLPRDFALEAVIVPTGDRGIERVKIDRGGFMLGASRFEVPPAELDMAQSQAYSLSGVHRSAEGPITCTLLVGASDYRFREQFASAALAPREALARVFYAKRFADLSPAEQKDVKARVPVCFP